MLRTRFFSSTGLTVFLGFGAGCLLLAFSFNTKAATFVLGRVCMGGGGCFWDVWKAGKAMDPDL